MDLNHSFTVPVDRATAWAAFQDIESVAECFPGATVTSVEGDTFQGTCKVKLGPVALQYSGSGQFIERDAENFRMLLEAKGRDKRGNGTAGANVTTTFLEEGPSSTRVDVVTDLNITGKPAQFGRGVMQDVSDKLLGQFVECLESRVGPPATAATEPQPAQSTGSAESAGSAPSAAQPVDEPPVAKVGAPPAGAAAIDLGTTVLPVLAKTYWKPFAGVVLVLFVLRWLRRR
jgi:carbon monoxide dehydrogenase subunit G